MTTQTLHTGIKTLDRTRRHQVRKLALVRALWLGLICWLFSFYLDSIFAFPDTYRLTINGIIALAALVIGMGTIVYLNRTRSRHRMLVRLIEQDHPHLQNELINAIEFEERLEKENTGHQSVALMEKEIERAIVSFDTLEELDSLKPQSLGSESRLLWGMLGLWLCSAIFLSSWFRTELLRFIMPWGDHPPYSATRLQIMPEGAIVEYGGDLTVKVTVAGQKPESLWLVVEDPAAGSEQKIGLFSHQDGYYHQTIKQIQTELLYYARADLGRSRRYPITLSKIPRIESIELSYHYPNYTNLPERVARLSDHKPLLKGYAGTEVALMVSSNRPLKSGEIKVAGQSVTCTPAEDNTVQGVITLNAPGNFEVQVTDIEGNVSTQSVTGQIELIPDDRPYVSIVSPGVHSLAIPTAEVPLAIEASDDLGIDKVRLFLSHNESDDTRKQLFAALEVQTQVDVGYTLDLADLGLLPGDVIDYYATATDTEPNTPQTVASEPYKIQIISAEDYAQMQRDQMTAEDLRMHYDEIMGELEALVQEQTALEEATQALMDSMQDPNRPTPAEQERLAELMDAQAQLAQKTQALSDKLREEAENPAVYDIEKDYKEGLKQMAAQLDQASGLMQDSAGHMKDGQMGTGQCAADMSQANKKQQEALAAMGEQTEAMREAIAQANRDLEKMMDLMSDIETFKQLYQAQKHLARQTKSLNKSDAEDMETRLRLKELAEREMDIKEDLEQLAKDLRSHGDAIAEDYPVVSEDAYKIADQIDSRKIPDLMNTGSDLLNQGQSDMGHGYVQNALEQMEAMIAFCEGAAGAACKQCEFRLKINMNLNPGNTMSQLALGLNPGMGMNMGPMGAMGRGSSGFAGGQTEMALFGNDTFGQNSQQQSTRLGNQKAEGGGSAPEPSNPLAGNVEQLVPQDKRDMTMDVKGDGPMMAEYRKTIEAYFRRLAEDE